MEAAGVLSITFGLGCTLSNAVNLLPSHITRHLRILRQPLQITYTVFLVSLIAWSSLLFTTFLLLNPQPCSITSVLTALADQTSRTAFTALVMFSVRPPIHNTGERAVVFLFIGMRAIIGAVVVGFTRSTFMPVCFPRANPVAHGLSPGITQLCFDGVLMAISVVRAWVGWRARRGPQAGGLVAIVVAAMAWAISTAPFQLRAGSIFVRLIPTIVTLSILLALLRAYPEALFKLKEDNNGEEATGDRGIQRLDSNASQEPQQRQIYRQNTDVESLNKPTFTHRGGQSNSGLFRNVMGQPIVHPGTMVAWASEGSIPRSEPSASLVETRFPAHAGGKASISGPMLSGAVMMANEGRPKNSSSFSSASTRENRRTTRAPSISETPRTIASFAGLPTPTVFAPGHQRYNSQSSVRRKPSVARASIVQNTRGLPEATQQQGQYPVLPCPPQRQQHTGYRMSSNTYYTEDDDATTRYTTISHGFPLAPAPRAMPPASSEDIGDQRVLLVHSIEYDNPALVQSLLDEKAAYTTGRFTPGTTGVMRRSPSAATTTTLAVHREEDLNESPVLPSGLSPVLTRKRPVPDGGSRVLFPSDSPSTHSRNQSTSSKKSSRSSRSTSSAARISPPPPPPDQPLPPPPTQEKPRKSAPAPIKIMNSGGGMLGIPMSAVNNPTTPAPPTPYETAKAWIASMAPVRKNSGPVLVNIHSRKASSARTASISTLDQEAAPAPPPTVPPLVIPRRPSTSTASMLASNTEDDAQRESIVIELRQSMEEPTGDENESVPSLTTSSSQRQQSGFALRRGDEEEEDVFSTPSSYTPSSAGFSDSVIISDFEDAIELENMHARQQQQLPQHFKLGDKIPTFYSSRPANQGYGGRRKPPPVPLGMVPLRQRFRRPPPPPPPPPRRQSSRASIIPESVRASTIRESVIEPDTPEKQLRARLTLLATKQEAEQRKSDIGMLLQQLEAEASQQETQWKGMRQTLVLRDSMISPGSDFTDLTSEVESRRQSTRRSSLARLQMALERRMSVALTTATTDTTVASVGGWQKQLAEAQMAYIQQAPILNQRVEMLQNELQEEEEEEEQEIIEPLPPTVYVNPTLELSPTATGGSDEDEAEMFLSLGLFPTPPTPARLWSQPKPVPPARSSHLWSGIAQLPTALPAAIPVRPKKRIDATPLTLTTARLWSKTRELRVLPHEGLWRDPRRPKSIIRRRSSASSKKHRVTFVEAAAAPLPTETVGNTTTGLFGKLRNFKLWGGKATTNKRADPSADAATQRYTQKALPKLPVMMSKQQQQQQSRPIPKLWMKRSEESVGMMARTMLWPSGPGISMVQLAEQTPRGSRARVQETEETEETLLWTPAAATTAPASLWQKQSALWPHGAFISAAREGLWAARKSMQHADAAPRRQKKQAVMIPAAAAGDDVSLWRSSDVSRDDGKGWLWQAADANSYNNTRHLDPSVPASEIIIAINVARSVFSASSSDSSDSSLNVGTDPDKHDILVEQHHTNTTPPPNNTPSLWTPIAAPNIVMLQQQPTLWTLSHAGSAKSFLLTASPGEFPLKAPSNRKKAADPPKAEGSLWTLRRDEAKPSKPQLWNPASKSITGLWRDADVERPRQKLLWSQRAAKRTTEKNPERRETTYKPSNKPVVKVSGEMWKRQENEKSTTTGWMSRAVNEVKRQVSKEHQWPEMIVRKGKLIVGGSPRQQHLEEPASHQRPVLRRSHSSRTLIVEPQEPESPVEKVEVKIAGRLWNARTPSPTPAPVPETPLWAPETASRTTAAIPEPISAAATPKKQSFDLPKVSGSLWDRQQPKDVVVKRGKVVVGSHLWDHTESVQKPALRRSKSSMTIVAVEMTTGIEDAKMVEVKVAGRLWTATAPEPEDPPVVPASPLWTKETAMRTTDAIPERVIPAPRKASLDLPKLSGSLWNMQPMDVVVKKGKVVIGSHLWNHHSAQHAPVVRQSSHSRTLFAVEKDDEERHDEVTMKVGGRLWTAIAPSQAPAIPTAPESPLWSKETARRTTEAIPERVAPVPRTTSVDLPKVAGSLWSARDIAVKKGKVVVSSSLWGQSAQPAQQSLSRRSHSSLVVVNVEKKEELPVVEKVEVKIGGRLWTAAMSHTPAPAPIVIDVPTSPLWTKQTASRTTTATPERVTPAPRKMSVDLPRVSGSLWDKHIPRDVVVRKGKVVVARNSLWSHHHHDRAQHVVRTSRSSRIVFAEPEREEETEKVQVKVKVAGRLWSVPRPEILPATVAEESKSPLWTKETAERSTAAVPERIAPVTPKKPSSHELPKVTGSLWDGRDVVVKKGKVVVSDRLWGQPVPVARPVMQMSRSSRTVVAVEEEVEKIEKVEVKVGGRLWSASRSRAVSPAPGAVEVPKTSLWTPEAASRTTTAIPERVVPAPRKMSVQLPKATGSLWNMKRDVVVRKGKIVVDGLWDHHSKTAVTHPAVKKSKSSVVVFGVEREQVEEVKEKVEVKVGGRLWTAAVPTLAVAVDEQASLWTAATAERTTTAAPVKTTPAPRKKVDHLPKVSGSLWAIEELHPQIKKGKVVFSTSLWSHQNQQQPTVLRRSGSSRTLFVARKSDEEEVEKVEVKVAGRLWSATRTHLPSVPTVSSDRHLWTAPSPPSPVPESVELQLAVTEPLPRPKKATADLDLPKATGSLWDNRSITVKKGKVVVSENLWKQSHLAPRPVLRKKSSSRVLAVLPAEPEVEKNSWQVKVGGRLWKAETTGDVAPTVVAPLWTKETAERTTNALPERVATAPRRASIDLPKVDGSLWNGRDVTVKKGKIVVSNQLWCDHESSVMAMKKTRSGRVVVAVEDKEAEEVVEVKVAGRLWSAPAPNRVAAAVVSDAPLWTPQTASRTTAATPERGATAPRKMSLDLPKAIGSLWDQRPQDISIQKGKIVVNPSDGLWNEPSLRPPPVLRRSTSSRTLIAAPQHEQHEDVTIMVAGRLWTASKASPPPPEQDAQTLWTRPSSSSSAKSEQTDDDDAFSKYMALPAREIVVKKTRSGAHSVVVSGSLWNHQPTSSRQVEISVAGRLWTAPMPAPAPSQKLWTPPSKDAASEPTVEQRLLWRRDTASRTTDAAPQRGISAPRKQSIDLPKATGALWGELDEVPSLSRASTAASSASDDEEEEQEDVKVALRRMRSGRLWQPSQEVVGELEGRVIEVNRKKGVVVVGQQRRDRYFSLGPAQREEVNPVFMERLRIGSLRRKLRVTASVDESV